MFRHLSFAICMLALFLSGTSCDQNLATIPNSNMVEQDGGLKVSYDGGVVKELVSFHSGAFTEGAYNVSRYLAVRVEGKDPDVGSQQTLKIFKEANGKLSEVFSWKIESESSFRSMLPLNSDTVAGVIVTYEHPDYWIGDTIVFAMQDGQFRKVYQGNSSEFVDVDGDGIPEIFESAWPDGDGFPVTTTVYAWNDSEFAKVREMPWARRFEFKPEKVRKIEDPTSETRP